MGNTQIHQRPIGRRITPQRAQFRRLAESADIGSVTRAQLAVLAQSLTCTGLINGTESHLLVALINTAPAESFDKSGSRSFSSPTSNWPLRSAGRSVASAGCCRACSTRV